MIKLTKENLKNIRLMNKKKSCKIMKKNYNLSVHPVTSNQKK